MSEEPGRLGRLLEEAESEDADWINSVFDSSMRSVLDSGDLIEDNSDSESDDKKSPVEDPQTEVAPVVVAEESSAVVDDEDTQVLYALGYDDALIAEIQPKVLNVIVERRLGALTGRGLTAGS